MKKLFAFVFCFLIVPVLHGQVTIYPGGTVSVGGVNGGVSGSVPWANITGAPTIPTPSNWPGQGGCSAGFFFTAITNGANPTCLQVQYSQVTGVPTALPPNGSASGDLGGTFPSPVVNAIKGITVSGLQGQANKYVFVCNAGTYTPGHFITVDANGNCQDGGAAPGGTVTTTGYGINYAVNAVYSIGLLNTDTADIGATLNTILSKSSQCTGSTQFNPSAPNCVPARITFDPGRYLITTPVHPTGTSWSDMVFDCGGAASSYGGGKVVFDIQVPAGSDGFWFDANPASFHGPQFLGCVFEDGTVHTSSGGFNTSPSNVRSGLHLSNIDTLKGNYNEFQYFVGNTFNPNSVNGGTAPTTGFSCSVTLNNYVVTCAVPSGTTAGTVAMFGESSFNVLDSATGRPYQQEIYQASLSGTTLTLYLSTPYQHSTNATLYDWVINYNGHGLLLDGFGALRTANGTTGTNVGFTQYGNVENTYSYCTQFPLWFGGGGVQSYLSGGATNGTGGGTESISIYGTSRIRFTGGWFMNGCPNNTNSQAPNGRIADAIAVFAGGFSDTMRLDVDSNAYPFVFISENGHQQELFGNHENAGTQPYVRTCTAGLGSQSCTRAVWGVGDLTSGSHGQGTRIWSYINTYGIAIELGATARHFRISANIQGPAISNLQDIVLPSVGDANCASTTSCYALQSTFIDGTIGQYKYNSVSAPTIGATCTLLYQVLFGTDGTISVCSSALKWVSAGIFYSGQATLAAGTVTVSTSAVTGASNLQLTNCSSSGTPGILSVGTVTNNTSFVINSSSSSDTSTVCWMIH